MDRTVKYLIIDDEPIAHRIIEGYCTELDYLSKVGNAYNPAEASSLMREYTVDLIFLDINMPKLTGFEWLKTIVNPPVVIVTTAYQEHALEGYELNVVDYLLKPFSFPRFLKAVNKISHTQGPGPDTPRESQEHQKQDSFFIKGDKRYHQVHCNDILYVEAYGNYTKLYVADEMILCHEKISDIEALLPDDRFQRVHKSFIVAIEKIKLIQRNVIHIDSFTIPIGQTYRNQVNRLLSRK